MGRQVVRLTVDRLADVAEPCGTCVFWELDAVRRGRLADDVARANEKQAWTSSVLREWGSCGRVVLVDDAVVAHATYAPAAFVPGAAAFATAPASPDAVLLTALRVDPAHRGGGLGRLLVQAMARDLLERGGIRAVEAFGGPSRPAAASAVGARTCCRIPTSFLTAVGFRTVRAHPTAPRLRMDLRSVLTWRDEVEAALERLLGAVRPHPHPVPETRTPRSLE